MTMFSLSYAIGTPILSTLFGTVDRRRVIALALPASSPATRLRRRAAPISGCSARRSSWVRRPACSPRPRRRRRLRCHRRLSCTRRIGGAWRHDVAVAIGAPLGALIGNMAGWRATYLFVASTRFHLPVGAVAAPAAWHLRRKAVAQAARDGDRPARRVAVAHRDLPLSDRRLRGDLRFRAACDDGAGMPVAMVPAMLLCSARRHHRQLFERPALRPAGCDARCDAVAGRIAGICVLLTLILEFAPDNLAGPLLIALMLPWGIVGWMFPPAQASRLVAAAPELASLTMPLKCRRCISASRSAASSAARRWSSRRR